MSDNEISTHIATGKLSYGTKVYTVIRNLNDFMTALPNQNICVYDVAKHDPRIHPNLGEKWSGEECLHGSTCIKKKDVVWDNIGLYSSFSEASGFKRTESKF